MLQEKDRQTSDKYIWFLLRKARSGQGKQAQWKDLNGCVI